MPSIRGPDRAGPDLRRLAVVELGIEPRVLELVELAVEVDEAVAVPQQLDDLDRFLEAADRLGEVEAVGRVLSSSPEPRPRIVGPSKGGRW